MTSVNKCKHDPVIVHRTGGKPATEENFCGICGNHIWWNKQYQEWHTEAEAKEVQEFRN